MDCGSSFHFGFLQPEKEEQPPTQQEERNRRSQQSGAIAQAREVFPVAQECQQEGELLHIGSFQLRKGHVDNAKAGQLLNNGQVIDSDLIPGTYEGGFKLWEGSLDLAAFMMKHWALSPARLKDQPFSNCRCLELGCGQGIPGMLALLAGAEVHFQDYNGAVLTFLTAPNVAGNADRLLSGHPDVRGRARYFAACWGSFHELMLDEKLAGTYDMVFTAETLYNLSSQRNLYACIKQALKPGGKCYVAAKTYYFGVGGGTAAFREVVEEDDAMECLTIERIDDGSSNVREILILTFKGVNGMLC